MDSPTPRVPELHKKAGLAYAVTDDGVELPVIDVTHPAFALKLSDRHLAELVEAFVSSAMRRRRWLSVLGRLFYRIALSRSVLGSGLTAAAGSFLSSLNTYLMKLGPDNLGSDAAPVDRAIAASLPVLSMRLRLQDVATLLAASLGDRLEHDGARPCHLLNIGRPTAPADPTLPPLKDAQRLHASLQ